MTPRRIVKALAIIVGIALLAFVIGHECGARDERREHYRLYDHGT